jgi:hypothetical protein
MTTTDTSSGVDGTVPQTTTDDTEQGHNHPMNAACTSGCPQNPPPGLQYGPGLKRPVK